MDFEDASEVKGLSGISLELLDLYRTLSCYRNFSASCGTVECLNLWGL